MLADTLRAVAGTRLVDDDGEEHILELLPPATASEVAKLASECAIPLPTELREALAVSAGFANGPLESLGFLFSPFALALAIAITRDSTVPPM